MASKYPPLAEWCIQNNSDLMLDWDYERNQQNGFDPEVLKAKSNKKVYWKCHECGHEWSAVISSRTNDHGCPECALKHPPLIKWCRQNNSDLMLDWDYERNQQNGFDPKILKAKSNKEVYWKCHECGHEWRAAVAKRTYGQGCQNCGWKKIGKMKSTPKEGMDFKSQYPALIYEWDYEENDKIPIKPEKITSKCNRAVHWKCIVCGHKWVKSVAKRTYGYGCPRCGKYKQYSQNERLTELRVRESFPSIDLESNYRSDALLYKELDIFMPDYKIGIEYDGELFHKNTKRDEEKNEICRDLGINLIRIREPKCPPIDGCHLICMSMMGRKGIENAIAELLGLLSKMTGLSPRVTNFDYNEDIIRIISERPIKLHQRSVSVVKPELLRDWDKEKNKDLNPAYLPAGINLKVHWICHVCGHEWMSRVVDRVRGQGCPECGIKKRGKTYAKPKPGQELGTKCGWLIPEWDPENDGTPWDYRWKSGQKAKWICSACGNKWEAKIASRANGEGCRVCGIKRRAELRSIPKNKTLASEYPNIAVDWDYEENAKTPNDCFPSSGYEAHWKCHKCGYKWKAKVRDRVNNYKNHGGGKCPNCVPGRILTKEKSLGYKFPDLVDQWDYSKNEKTPYDYFPSSNEKVSWICSKGHRWDAMISNRTKKNRPTGCPRCHDERRSLPRKKRTS